MCAFCMAGVTAVGGAPLGYSSSIILATSPTKLEITFSAGITSGTATGADFAVKVSNTPVAISAIQHTSPTT